MQNLEAMGSDNGSNNWSLPPALRPELSSQSLTLLPEGRWGRGVGEWGREQVFEILSFLVADLFLSLTLYLHLNIQKLFQKAFLFKKNHAMASFGNLISLHVEL